ncbi:MAG TPA: phage terminase large subunit [Gemmataceae bacterium]|jgi:predicted phage terminase large subunit-like protein
MSAPSTDIARLLAAAADLRAAGASWDAVADRLHRSPDTCRRWPARFPAVWADLYRQAERRQAAEARAEATNILRNQLRHEDDKARRDAAKRCCPPPPAAATPNPTRPPTPSPSSSPHFPPTMSPTSPPPAAAPSTPTGLTDLVRATAERSRFDPAAFAAFVLTDPAGRTLCPAPVHRELQAFLSRHPRALVELPRDHGKSVQVCVRLLWELGRNPGLRIRVVCASEALAVERGRFVRDAIAANPRLRLVFPYLRPGVPWEAVRFTVRRMGPVLGPSVAAVGVGAATTGARADLLVCDDIVDVRALRSRADRERVAAYFHENLVNLLEPDGRLWCLFTPWHADDLNARLKRNPAFALFRRPVGDELQPVWPAKWPREALERRRAEIGAVAFARAYRLVCVPDEAVPIRAAWVRFWTEPAEVVATVLAVDPAVSVTAKADASALVTLARTADNQVRCLEATARRVPAPELVHLIDDADRRWRPDAILFEDNGGFAAVRDLLVRHARFGPKVRGVKQSRDKAARVSAFSVPVENGTFRLKGDGSGGVDAGQQALFDEMTTFPAGEHDDLVDAAAFGAEYLLNHPEPRVFG